MWKTFLRILVNISNIHGHPKRFCTDQVIEHSTSKSQSIRPINRIIPTEEYRVFLTETKTKTKKKRGKKNEKK